MKKPQDSVSDIKQDSIYSEEPYVVLSRSDNYRLPCRPCLFVVSYNLALRSFGKIQFCEYN